MRGSWHFTKGELSEERGLRGTNTNSCDSVIPNTLRVIPTTIVTFVVYENTKLYLPKVFNDDEEFAHDED